MARIKITISRENGEVLTDLVVFNSTDDTEQNQDAIAYAIRDTIEWKYESETIQ